MSKTFTEAVFLICFLWIGQELHEIKLIQQQALTTNLVQAVDNE